MMYLFLTLDDETEIVHSKLLENGRVYIEKPDAKDCFHNAECYPPDYSWENINGFSLAEIARYQSVIESTAHLILRFAKEEVFENAAGL